MPPEPTAEADWARHLGFSSRYVIAGGPGSLAVPFSNGGAYFDATPFLRLGHGPRASGPIVRHGGPRMPASASCSRKKCHMAGLKLNLGCGDKRIPGYINVDKFSNPDLKHDLETFPWPWPDDSVSEILLIHVLEHLGQETRV